MFSCKDIQGDSDIPVISLPGQTKLYTGGFSTTGNLILILLSTKIGPNTPKKWRKWEKKEK